MMLEVLTVELQANITSCHSSESSGLWARSPGAALREGAAAAEPAGRAGRHAASSARADDVSEPDARCSRDHSTSTACQAAAPGASKRGTQGSELWQCAVHASCRDSGGGSRTGCAPHPGRGARPARMPAGHVQAAIACSGTPSRHPRPVLWLRGLRLLLLRGGAGCLCDPERLPPPHRSAIGVSRYAGARGKALATGRLLGPRVVLGGARSTLSISTIGTTNFIGIKLGRV
eukprot:2509883-Prymnesium_polylepis.1